MSMTHKKWILMFTLLVIAVLIVAVIATDRFSMMSIQRRTGYQASSGHDFSDKIAIAHLRVRPQVPGEGAFIQSSAIDKVEFAVFSDGRVIVRDIEDGVRCGHVGPDVIKRLQDRFQTIVENDCFIEHGIAPSSKYDELYVRAGEKKKYLDCFHPSSPQVVASLA